ncbi:DUF948 domain-containing protein [Chloroflexota bacterium]
MVRIHKADKPRGINWGDYVKLSLDKKNWVTCRVEPAGEIGMGKIYIGIHLRGLLNKNTTVMEIAKLEVPCNIYVIKAFSWKVFLYVTIGIIVAGAFAFLVYFLIMTGY